VPLLRKKAKDEDKPFGKLYSKVFNLKERLKHEL
jgi:hypothetical protein